MFSKIKILSESMVLPQAKEYVATEEYRIVTRDDIEEIDDLPTDWFLVDEVTTHEHGEAGFHDSFPEQEYPTICRAARGEIAYSEGSPRVKYRILLVSD